MPSQSQSLFPFSKEMRVFFVKCKLVLKVIIRTRLLFVFLLWSLSVACVYGSIPELGEGFPGTISAYEADSALQKEMSNYNLSAWWFQRNPVINESESDGDGEMEDKGGARARTSKSPNREIDSLPYLLFRPNASLRKPVPLLLYFGGTGEHGTNLVDQFHQKTIFSVVASSRFQSRHPCYLVAPMLPKGAVIRACVPEHTKALSRLICDLMYALIREMRSPPIDASRVYLTGLSFGGVVAFELPCQYPGRFAASVPVGCQHPAEMIPMKDPGNYYLLYNEGQYGRLEEDESTRTLRDVVIERGGDFRISTFPESGHNAWDRAWREMSVWDWMFSKTTSRGGRHSMNRVGSAGVPLSIGDVTCKASMPGKDGRTGPERAVDGLDSTCYISCRSFGRGDWWQADFAAPIGGRLVVYAGGDGQVLNLAGFKVYITHDGRNWRPAGSFSEKTGVCEIVLNRKFKGVRIVGSASVREPLVLREVRVFPK